MSESNDYERLMEAFETLRDADVETRAYRLDVLRREAPAWADQLEALLQADAEVGSPLEQRVRLTTSAGRETRRSGRSDEATGGRGDVAAPSLPAPLGERLGMYRLVEVIGRGGMGCVYRGEHIELGRAAAVKVLEPHLTVDEAYVSRFLYEAKIVNAVHHPNIVDIFDFIDSANPRRVAFVMELLDGSTLGQVLSSRALSVGEALQVTFQLCDALAAVHACDIVHRDLKPDNVMVLASPALSAGSNITVKLLDFGVAKVSDPLAMHRTASGVMLGTPTYMAPEQFSAERVTPASDVYALAELLFEMLTQQPVFAERGLPLIQRKMSSAPHALSISTAGVRSEALGRLLQACLSVEPDQRPTLVQFRAELTELYAGLGGVENSPAAAPLLSAQVGPRRARRRPLLRSAMVASVVVALVVAASQIKMSPSGEPADVPVSTGLEPSAGQPTRPAKLPLVLYEGGMQPSAYKPVRNMGFFQALDIKLEARDPLTGSTCIRIRYAEPHSWAGAIWMDPVGDFGAEPGGYILTGASTLSFRARGARGGEVVRFGYGLIARDEAYYDSARDAASFELTKQWMTYAIDLEGQDLSRIKVGFLVALGVNTTPVEFYIDKIQYR